jgi:transposase
MEAIKMDLRGRVLHALDVEKQCRVAVAKRFAVSNAWIGKLLRQRRDAGSIEPRPHAGGPAPKLNDPSVLRALVDEKPDATLAELSDAMAERHGIALHVSNIARRLKGLGITLKKRSCTPANAKVNE